MNIFALFSLLSCVVCFFLGNYVYSQDKKSALNRVFLLFCISLSYWAFMEFMHRQADNSFTAYFWVKAGIFWPFTMSFLLHFTLLFTEKQKILKNKLAYFLIYLPAVIWIVIDMTTSSITSGVLKTYWGWTYDIPKDSWVYWLNTLWAVVIGILSLLICVQYYASARDLKKRKQAKYVAIALLIPLIAGIITELPLWGETRLPELTTLSMTWLAIFVMCAIKRHELFSFKSPVIIEAMLSNIPAGIWVANAEPLQTIYINHQVEELHQHKLVEFQENPYLWLELVHPEDKERFLSAMGPLLKEGKDFEIEYRIVRPDGSIRWVDASTKAIHNEKGKVVQLWGIVMDITERKRSEESQQRSENKYRFLIENIPQKIFYKDSNSVYVSCNENYARDLKIKSEEIVNKTDHDFFPKELAEKYKADDKRIMDLGNIEDMEEKYVQDGQEVWVHTIKTPAKDEEGNCIGILGIFWDITDRKRSEMMLRESEEKYRDLFENATDLIQIIGLNGNILYANRAWRNTLGYNEKEISKLSLLDIIHPDSKAHCMELFQKVTREGSVSGIETMFITKGGRTIIVNGDCNCHVKDAVPVSVRGIFRDITERKRVEEQFFQSQKMGAIGTLAGGIAHDFNNLLFIIMGNAELLKAEMTGISAEQLGLLGNIESSAKRGADLVKNLLTFARGEKGAVKPTNINKVVEEAVKILGRTVEKMINIETHLAPDLWAVNSDVSQMHQTILNICVNARDAMPNGGRLTIETKNVVIDEGYTQTHIEAMAGKFVRISISDTGTGMDKETLQHIFEPFFTTKERSRGTGLGLAVSYGIVKAHKGFINVYSEKGKGSCFKIYLPATSEKIEAKPDVTEEKMPMKNTGIILVVDDDPGIRDVSKAILERTGYNVIIARDGKEGIEIYRQKKDVVTMVILDYIMPGLSGKETFLELIKINPEIKVLISTGYSMNSHGQELLQIGVKGFIQKPFSAKELFEQINDIIAKG